MRFSRLVFVLNFVFLFSVSSWGQDDGSAQVTELIRETVQKLEAEKSASNKDEKDINREIELAKGKCAREHKNFITKYGSALPSGHNGYSDLYTNCVDGYVYDSEPVIKELKETIEKEHEASIASCEKEEKVAAECCGYPERCFKKPDGENNENEGIFGQMLQLGLSTALVLPSQSIAGQCAKMGSVSNLVTGINMYLSVQCGRYVGQCKKTCGDELKKLKEDPICKSGQLCDDIIAKYEFSLNECKTADNQSARLAAQAIASQASARMANLCKNLAEDETKPSKEDLFSNADCNSPGSASTPFCQALCSKAVPGDPKCGAFFNRDNNFGGPTFGTASGNGRSGLFDNLVDSEEGPQSPNFEDIAAVGASSTGSNGGGGGAGLGGGGGGGGYDGGGGGGYSDEGYNTKIDRGLASGNGYTTVGPNLRSGVNGGFRGYGGGKAITDKGKKFSLKDYLPGGKNNKRVQLRGLASLANDIAPAHTDIFKQVTNRFHSVCLRNALYDCATLKKRKLGE